MTFFTCPAWPHLSLFYHQEGKALYLCKLHYSLFGWLVAGADLF
jgi:hypothetical protein